MLKYIPKHYISKHMIKAFKGYKDADVQNTHPTADGWQTTLICNISGQKYIVNVEPFFTNCEVCSAVIKNVRDCFGNDDMLMCKSCYDDALGRADYLAECQWEDERHGL